MLYQPPLDNNKKYAIYKCTGINGFQLHWHYEIELLFCTAGELSVDIGDKTYIANVGECIVVSSAADHNFMPANDNTEALVIEFGSAFLGKNFSAFVNRVFEIKPKSGKLLSILKNLDYIHPVSEDDIAGKLTVKSLLNALAATMLTSLESHELSPDEVTSNLKKISIIHPVLDYISREYPEPLSVSDAAKLTHYEDKSFCRAFKEATGITFHQYLNMYRIDQACIMLTSGGYKVHEIGKMCGIPQAKSFSRLFRKYTGMTPSEYIIKKGAK